VTAEADHDLALLSAAARHHSSALSLPVSSALSAAVDELTDPTRLLSLLPVPEHDSADLEAALRAVLARLQSPADPRDGVAYVLRRARAAREVAVALRLLLSQQP